MVVKAKRLLASAFEIKDTGRAEYFLGLQITIDVDVTYGIVTVVQCYCDADFAGDTDNRRSTSGMCVLMNGGAVMWRGKQQSVVATFTC